MDAGGREAPAAEPIPWGPWSPDAERRNIQKKPKIRCPKFQDSLIIVYGNT